MEIYSHKRYFYLEAQSFAFDHGHAELFLWLWFLGKVRINLIDQYIHAVWIMSANRIYAHIKGTEAEELHYRYHLTVIHGKSEYSYRGPVTSLTKSPADVRNEGRCLVVREKIWDYMSYKLRITRH